ncbi:vasopressin V2 receptor-like, partial [Neolamprologus brichardi]|uniref:vasopressin V2 receptor-like n=1 Tax=Neolamprologus brichardi TaxID=32507 RepID=UPI0003EC13FE
VLPQLVWDAKGRFPGPDFLCRLVKYLQVLGMFASSYMIVAMTVDRHYAICCPLQAHRSGATKRWNSFIVLAWVLSLLLSLPQVFIFSRSELAPGVYECWGNFAESWGLKAYVTWMTLAIFVLPVLIITICQVRIFKEIHNNLYLKSDCRLCPAALPQLRKETQRGKRGGGEGKSNVPFYVSPLAYNNPGNDSSLDPASTYQHLPMGVVFTLLMLLASLNSCTNPWIYSAFSSSVSPELRLLLHCRLHTWRRASETNDSTITHTSN